MVKNKEYLIRQHNSNLVFESVDVPKNELPKGVLGICKGTFAVIRKSKNVNGRVYNKANYDSVLKPLQKRIKQRALLGEMEHVQRRTVHYTGVSHRITSIEWDEKTSSYIGTIEILDTAKGRDLFAIAQSGVIFISSRGLGQDDKNGVMMLSKIITYDVVAESGFPEAQLELVNESADSGVFVDDSILMIPTEHLIDESIEDKEFVDNNDYYHTIDNNDKSINENKEEKTDNDMDKKIIKEIILECAKNGELDEYILESNSFKDKYVSKDNLDKYITESLVPKYEKYVTESINDSNNEIVSYLSDEMQPNMEQLVTESVNDSVYNMEQLVTESRNIVLDITNKWIQNEVIPDVNELVLESKNNIFSTTSKWVGNTLLPDITRYVTESKNVDESNGDIKPLCYDESIDTLVLEGKNDDVDGEGEDKKPEDKKVDDKSNKDGESKTVTEKDKEELKNKDDEPVNEEVTTIRTKTAGRVKVKRRRLAKDILRELTERINRLKGKIRAGYKGGKHKKADENGANEIQSEIDKLEAEYKKLVDSGDKMVNEMKESDYSELDDKDKMEVNESRYVLESKEDGSLALHPITFVYEGKHDVDENGDAISSATKDATKDATKGAVKDGKESKDNDDKADESKVDKTDEDEKVDKDKADESKVDKTDDKDEKVDKDKADESKVDDKDDKADESKESKVDDKDDKADESKESKRLAELEKKEDKTEEEKIELSKLKAQKVVNESKSIIENSLLFVNESQDAINRKEENMVFEGQSFFDNMPDNYTNIFNGLSQAGKVLVSKTAKHWNIVDESTSEKFWNQIDLKGIKKSTSVNKNKVDKLVLESNNGGKTSNGFKPNSLFDRINRFRNM